MWPRAGPFQRDGSASRTAYRRALSVIQENVSDKGPRIRLILPKYKFGEFPRRYTQGNGHKFHAGDRQLGVTTTDHRHNIGVWKTALLRNLVSCFARHPDMAIDVLSYAFAARNERCGA